MNYFIFAILNYFYKGGPYSLPTPIMSKTYIKITDLNYNL